MLRILAQVVEKVVSGSACEEVDLVFELGAADVVDEVVDASVAAYDDDLVIALQSGEELFVVLDVEDADLFQLLALKDAVQLPCLFLTGVSSGLWIENRKIRSLFSMILHQ